MASLQKTFQYKGDANNAPFRDIMMEIRIPSFSYYILPTDLTTHNSDFQRKIEGYTPISYSLKLTEEEYYISLLTEEITGDNINSKYGFFRFHEIESLGPINFDKLSFEIKVIAKDEFGNGIETLVYDALYGVQFNPQGDVSRGYTHEKQLYIEDYGTFEDPNQANVDKLIRREKEKNRIFLINKKVFDTLKESVKTMIGGDRSNLDSFLLSLIEGFVDLSDVYPKLIHPIESNREQWLNHMMGVTEIGDDETEERVKNLIYKHFDKLFDFPVSIPEIKTVEVKGTFTIESEEKVNESQLEFYNLTVEYPQTGENYKIIRYDWSKHDNVLNDDHSTSISFTKNHPILHNSVSEKIIVQVKGFDGTVLWREEYNPDDPTLQNLAIIVPLYIPGFKRPDATKTNNPDSKKLRGRVVQLGKKYNLNELTVLVQAKKEGDELYRIIGSAQTDNNGNFSLPYPYGIYNKAEALVSLMPNSPADIEVSDENEARRNLETISDDFIFLLLKDNEVVDQEECECEDDDDECGCETSLQKTKRLPDQADLIESGEYTQDLGGTCMNLSTPNRTLREYNYNAIVRMSDPDVANYTLKKRVVKDKDGNTEIVYDLVGGKTKIKREVVDLNNPIRWEDSPDSKSDLSLYQAVTVATGHIIHFKSIFKADGYSLGDLIYSLPLAPGQKKQIVVIDSTHSFTGAETQSISQGEKLSASLLQDRLITDEIGGRVGESVSGRSNASTSGFSAGLGASGSYNGLGASLGVSGGFSNSNSSASQNSSRNVSQYFDEILKQQITQSAESFRELNASVVTTVSEGQEYGVTAETIANHNHCHSLTMMYFEVLRHYAIFQEVSHVEECIFVPLLMTNFTTNNIHKWKDVLAKHLLPIPSDTYLQPFAKLFGGRRHPLLKGFDAIERIKTDYENIDFPSGTYADDPITEILGYLTIRTNIPRPKTFYDRILSFPVVEKEKTTDNHKGFFGFIADVFVGSDTTTTTWEEREKIIDEHIVIYDNFQRAKPADVIEVIKFDDIFDINSLEHKLWHNIASLCGESNLTEFMRIYFSNKTISQWDSVFNNEILPKVFESLISDKISISPFSNIDITTSSKYHGGDRLMRVDFKADTSLSRKDIDEIKISLTSSLPHPSDFWEFIILNVHNIKISYSTKFYNGVIFNKYIGDDLRDGVSRNTPRNSDELRNPRKEDQLIAQKLIEHLNSNLEHYNKVLWYNLDGDRRYMLLDGFNIETYDSFGHSKVFRSLASIVKNQLITVAGNSLVLPVADGFKVSKSFIMENAGDGVEQEIPLLDYYKPFTPVPPYRISIPTKGVFMEAIMGQCDACEMVKENSSQDWDRFTTEETTSIQPIITPTPTVTAYNPQYKDFASPMINIQNAPDAPQPGVGFNQLTELLGKAGVFNDVTGLSGTQENAIKTYLSNQENAKAFAEMSKSLVTQQHNTSNAENISKGITSARKKGAISVEDEQDLTKQHLQQQIDGGESMRKSAQFEREQGRSSLTTVAAEAAKTGQPVKAEKHDSEGNSEKIEIALGHSQVNKNGESANSKYVYRVPEKSTSLWVSQGSKVNGCWAAAATMMMSWKDQEKYSIESVLKMTPDEYLEIYNEDRGLRSSEINGFISNLGMVSKPPASYSPETYIEWIKQYGPLWINMDSDTGISSISPHAKVLIGYKNVEEDPDKTKLLFLDSALKGEQEVYFSDFIQEYEQLVTDNPGDLFIQIIHFKNSLNVIDDITSDEFLNNYIDSDILETTYDVWHETNNGLKFTDEYKDTYIDEPETNFDQFTIPEWIDKDNFYEVLKETFSKEAAAIIGDSTKEVKAKYFVIHDTATEGRKFDPKKTGNNVHLWIASNHSIQTKDWNEAGDATKVETSNNTCFVHVELKRHPAKLDAIEEIKAKDTYYSYNQYALLAVAYIIASLRKGSFLTVTIHREVDRAIRYKKGGKTVSGHGDPEKFDIVYFYNLVSKLLGLPEGITFGIQESRVLFNNAKNQYGYKNVFIDFAKGDVDYANQYGNPELSNETTLDPSGTIMNC